MLVPRSQHCWFIFVASTLFLTGKGNDFVWISKKLLLAANLTVRDALIFQDIPAAQYQWPVVQDYVWFPRGCRQPWAAQEELEAAAEAVGGLDIFLVGTSRLR